MECYLKECFKWSTTETGTGTMLQSPTEEFVVPIYYKTNNTLVNILLLTACYSLHSAETQLYDVFNKIF